jgi:hypothetical protein
LNDVAQGIFVTYPEMAAHKLRPGPGWTCAGKGLSPLAPACCCSLVVLHPTTDCLAVSVRKLSAFLLKENFIPFKIPLVFYLLRLMAVKVILLFKNE